MSEITRLAPAGGPGKKVRVFLDGQPGPCLLAATAAEEGLWVGQQLSAARLAALAEADNYRRCLEAAVRYLAYRPRSEAEVRQRLQRRGFDGSCIARTLARLKEQALVDDAAFARFWAENREAFRPRSRRLTRLELQRKGLDAGDIEPAVGDMDDGESAYRAALSRARRLDGADYPAFRRRLGEYLRRRGFGYEVIRTTVARLWREIQGSPA